MGDLVAAAASYLADRGRHVAARSLRRQGLPADLADDVTQEALIRALRAQERGDDPDNLEAFVTTLVNRTVLDLVRGQRRRPEGHRLLPVPTNGDDDATDPLAAVPASGAGPDLEVLAGLELVDLRHRLARRLGDVPVPAAGALAVVAVVAGGAAPSDDCPVPAGGVADHDAVHWPGLFYAGEHRCFPQPGEVEGAAMRKRRSRAIARQRAVLAAAIGEEPRG